VMASFRVWIADQDASSRSLYKRGKRMMNSAGRTIG
jgi:hypothetical protein